MAKKSSQPTDEQQRLSRKEVLLARKQERQTRNFRLALAGVVLLLVVVLSIGIINELLLKPSRPVAIVEGTEIPMRDWQERVRFQRAQIIIGIEDLAEVVGQDIGQVQQFAGQQIGLLLEPESIGQFVLDQTIDEEFISQEAEKRGILVSDSEVQEELETGFGYYGGKSPTATPIPSETPIPTPSITPFPTAVITEVVPTDTPSVSPTEGPTSTPLPTPTAVSQEAFDELFGETVNQLGDMSSDEESLRNVIRAQLLQDKLMEALAEEQNFSEDQEQVSFFYLGFENKDEAMQAQELVADGDFISVWNGYRSRTNEEAQLSTVLASEAIWRTEGNIVDSFGDEVAQAAFDQAEGQTSGILVQVSELEDGTTRYFIISVNGREVRPLDEATINELKREILAGWLEEQRLSSIIEVHDRWRASVPRQPILDPRFLVAPTPAPPTPTLGVPVPIETPIP